MANQTAKLGGFKPHKPQTPSVSSATSPSTADSRANIGSTPNSLLGSTLGPATARIRQTMIAEAAYYIAEQRGFGSGREVEDWLLAEKQIDATLCA
jgi:hypothetical protein